MGPIIQLAGVEVPLLSLSAVPLLGVLAAGLLHARACSILATRGRTVPTTQRVSWYAGLALILVATQTFIDPVGETGLMSVHMVQHLLIADLPAPLLLYGLRAPVLYFYWPRPVLVTVARLRRLRAFWGWLRRPHVAMLVWLGTLYAWHLPVMYEAALTNRLVHDLEHVSFALTGVLAWWPLLDPTHNRVVGQVWKAAYVFAARTAGGVLGIVLMVQSRPTYGAYADGAREFGVSALADQRVGAGTMMMVDITIIIVGVTWFLVTIDRGAEYRDDLPESARQLLLAEHAAAQAATRVDTASAAPRR